MNELKLHATSGNWRLFIGRKSHKAFRPIEQKVFERDRYICQFCGFQAQRYQEVVNLDHDYRNNRLTNLATACCFCSQCFFLESVGLDNMSGGQVIYLPEFTQNELNSLCHVLFCAMDGADAYNDSAQTIYRSLRLRSQVVEKEVASGMSNPMTLGRLLVEARAKYPKAHYEFLHNLRLLPSYSKFKVQLGAWAESALAELAQREPVPRA